MVKNVWSRGKIHTLWVYPILHRPLTVPAVGGEVESSGSIRCLCAQLYRPTAVFCSSLQSCS